MGLSKALRNMICTPGSSGCVLVFRNPGVFCGRITYVLNMKEEFRRKPTETSSAVKRGKLRLIWPLAVPFVLVGVAATFYEMEVIRHVRWCNPVDKSILVSCEPIWPTNIWFAGYAALAWLLSGMFVTICLKKIRRSMVFLLAAVALVVFYISGAVFSIFEPVAEILM